MRRTLRTVTGIPHSRLSTCGSQSPFWDNLVPKRERLQPIRKRPDGRHGGHLDERGAAHHTEQQPGVQEEADGQEVEDEINRRFLWHGDVLDDWY